jgi:hypothetical protein
VGGVAHLLQFAGIFDQAHPVQIIRQILER